MGQEVRSCDYKNETLPHRHVTVLQGQSTLSIFFEQDPAFIVTVRIFAAVIVVANVLVTVGIEPTDGRTTAEPHRHVTVSCTVTPH